MFIEDTKNNRVARWLRRTPRALGTRIRALLTGNTRNNRLDWRIGRALNAPPGIDSHLQELMLKYDGLYIGDTSKNRIALTFDAAYSDDVPALLSTLRKHDVRASFFLTGKWVESHAPVFEELVGEGHLVGNHSYSHPDFRTITLKQVANEINRTDEAIIKHGGRKPVFFRPPFGYFTEPVLGKVCAMGYCSVLWSICMQDWEPMDQEQLIHGVTDYLHNGAIVLLHVTLDGVRALDTTIPQIKVRGYELVKLSQLTRS